MGKHVKPTDEELLNYLDGTVNPDEAAAINHALVTDQEVAQRMEELRSVHHYFLTLTKEEPSNNFTQRVMENLHYTTSHAYSPRNGLMLLIGVMLAVGIAVALLAGGIFD
jgi:anti-sigma factor RsiW